MDEMELYEHPVNELLRVCLRLEYLFQQGAYYLEKTDYFDAKTAISTLIDIINVLDRPDFRSKLTTELIRYQEIIQKLETKAAINIEKLHAIVATLGKHIHYLENTYGKIGNDLRENEFLSSIRFVLSRPGGGWSFDNPLYHHWLQQDTHARQRDLANWFASFIDVKTIIEYMLNLVRDWATPAEQIAKNGFYQSILDPKLPYQLLQLWLPKQEHVIPEISFGKHRLTIRFLDVDYEQRAQQTCKEISCKINLCVL